MDALRALLDSAVDAIFVVDPEGRVTFANRSLGQLIALSPESLLGKPLEELIEAMGGAIADPESLRGQWGELVKAPAEEVVVRRLEYRTDKRHYLKETSFPLRRRDGTVLGRVFVLHDITREQELNQMKNEFLSIASHELRTPMTSIKGSLDLLLGGFAGELSGETRELLEIAQSGCERLIRLINDILDLSKIEAGRMQLKLQPMSLFDSVQRSARTIKTYADGFNVTVEIDCPEALPEVWGDRDRLDQVVTNLLGNAVKFSPPGGTITVALRAYPDVVQCAVIDRGPGIPADELGRIFAKFHQSEGARRKGGTGLGLAIAQALVQQHKGKIWVESKLGEGSHFFFQIPRAPANNAT
ncbi:MAG: PAS domain-containing protein [Acidobacteria bacterium]|nr:PAS domain-containing protein [Acidobacteriota bacterium]